MALKVLIYVPVHTDSVGIHHELTTRLANGISGKVAVRLATTADKDAAQSVGEYDVVHIFGSWSKEACSLGRKAYAAKVPYIITPLGGLQPWEMEHHNHTPVFNHQKWLTSHAAAIHVCGKLEQQTLEQLGWNGNICQIKNPVLTSIATFDDLCAGIQSLYRKVLDTNVRLRMGDDECTVVGNLLLFGIDPQAMRNDTLVASVRAALSRLSEEAWRRILIYVADEKVEEPIKDSLSGMNIDYPRLDVRSFVRFDTGCAYPDGHLNDETLLSRNILLRNKVKEVLAHQGAAEQSVCLALLNFQYELGRHEAPLLHLADLYSLVRFVDFDEDAFKTMARELKIDDFAARVMAVMADFLGLTEGFMPIDPKDDTKTATITNQVTKFGTHLN